MMHSPPTSTRLILAFALASGCAALPPDDDIEISSEGLEILPVEMTIDSIDVGPRSDLDPLDGSIALHAGHTYLSVHFATGQPYLDELEADLEPSLELIADGVAHPIASRGHVVYSTVTFDLEPDEIPTSAFGSVAVTVGGRRFDTPDMFYFAIPGDANLDYRFDSSDLVQVQIGGVYEQDAHAGWSDGDFNGDGRFDTRDLVTVGQGGLYEQPGLDSNRLERRSELQRDDHEASLPSAMRDDSNLDCYAVCFLVRSNYDVDMPDPIPHPVTPPTDSRGNPDPTFPTALCSPAHWSVNDEYYGGEHESNIHYDYNACYGGDPDAELYPDEEPINAGSLSVQHSCDIRADVDVQCRYYRRHADSCTGRSCNVVFETSADIRTMAAASADEGDDERHPSSSRAEASVRISTFDPQDGSHQDFNIRSQTATGDSQSCLGTLIGDAAYLNLSCTAAYPVTSSSCSAQGGLNLTWVQFEAAMACLAGDEAGGQHATSFTLNRDDDGRETVVEVAYDGDNAGTAALGVMRLTARSSYDLVSTRRTSTVGTPEGPVTLYDDVLRASAEVRATGSLSLAMRRVDVSGTTHPSFSCAALPREIRNPHDATQVATTSINFRCPDRVPGPREP